jgi:hypothetical protein
LPIGRLLLPSQDFYTKNITLSLNQTQANKFINYHANPNAISSGDLQVIYEWLEKYPYCQSLHFLASKTTKNSASYPTILAKAAAIAPSRTTLHDFIYRTDFFAKGHKAIAQSEISNENSLVADEIIEHIELLIDEIDSLDQQLEAADSEPELLKNKEEEQEPHQVVADLLIKASELQIAAKDEEDTQSISTYHDERLPYTFLWWLNKTRKEHATNLQPYVSFKLDTSKQIRKVEADVLNHQIAENIFHLKTVDDLSHVKYTETVPFDFRKKEYQIIEKFIKEEPQIKPPIASKIDTENKAKRSSEDENEVVSETLAKIYAEQMLYHKALDAYKKLSLKFPEKSTYFASQIKYLELKVN